MYQKKWIYYYFPRKKIKIVVKIFISNYLMK